LYLIGAACGSLAVLVSFLSNRKAALVAAMILALMLLAVAGLERAPYERQKAKRT
jgi:hypothetical protein